MEEFTVKTVTEEDNKPKNILILCMASQVEPGIRNVNAMYDTLIEFYKELKVKKLIKNNFYFLFYSGNEPDHRIFRDEYYDKHMLIFTNDEDDVYHTYEKTISAYREVIESGVEFDWILRTNISSYTNIRLVDDIVSEMDDDKIYANAINSINFYNTKYVNQIYPRGDFYMMSYKLLKEIMASSEANGSINKLYDKKTPYEHTDDVLFGVNIIDHFGLTEYYKHLVMITYGYLPEQLQNMTQMRELFLPININYRCKTTPPNTYSGYSWGDNEFRMHDAEKFRVLKEYAYLYKIMKPKHITDIVVDLNDPHARPTIFFDVKERKNMGIRVIDLINKIYCNNDKIKLNVKYDL